MSRSFTSFAAAAKYMQNSMIRNVKRQVGNALENAAQAVADDARKSIGQYKNGVGPYPQWAPLKDPETINRKKRARAQKPYAPLLRSGKFLRSIDYSVNKSTMVATVGTNLDYVVNTELGTRWMKPRPVFGPAALRVLPGELKAIQMGAVAGLMGVSLGYGVGTFAGGNDTGGHII